MTTTQTTRIDAHDPRIVRLLREWHEAGRAAYEASYTNLNYDKDQTKTATLRRKYIALDIGTSGAWLVDRTTGEVCNIKAYGTPDKQKRLGTLDTITGADLHAYRWWYRR